jgi:hypothetical protein
MKKFIFKKNLNLHLIKELKNIKKNSSFIDYLVDYYKFNLDDDIFNDYFEINYEDFDYDGVSSDQDIDLNKDFVDIIKYSNKDYTSTNLEDYFDLEDIFIKKIMIYLLIILIFILKMTLI